MLYFIIFIIFAFVGWVVDSAYCSIEKKTLVISGYFKKVPLCPIYGFGGILLLNTFSLLEPLSPILIIVTATLLITLLELFGGWFSVQFLEERLWDYSNEPFNFRGYISIWHSFLWLISVTGLYFLVGNKANLIMKYLESTLNINPRLEILVLFLVIVISLWLTIINKRVRLISSERFKFQNANSLESIFNLNKLRYLESERRKQLLSNRNISAFVEKMKNFRHKKVS